ncbi:ABC transporter ATP-binding protein [Kribbella sp. NPDC048915]|uniref:ABC transporter ATP-binding protein n=1 Tax=Kribbella sp. NPDC048915 TaxID=3155148 RepID=UPI0033DFB4AE
MAAAESEPAAVPGAEPTVIADQLDIVYKLIAGQGGKGTAATALRRIMRRQDRPTIREVHAVKNVSFTAYKGDAIGVIGRNGSGKSTLLRAIAGLLPPASGAVYTSGRPSLLGVNAAMMNDLTGDRNVVLGCLAMGMSPAEVKRRYDEIVEFSGIGEFIDLPMSAYSSGMAARLKFAIASAKTHDILLVDEALATGDAEFRVRSERRIKELRDQAGTVFLVSHSLEVVQDTCNRALWLDNGVLKLDGPVDEVVNAYIRSTRA